MRSFVPWILILPLLVSCSSDETCDPAQSCAVPFSLDVTVRNPDGSAAEGIEILGAVTPDYAFPVSSATSARLGATTLQFALSVQCFATVELQDVHGDVVRHLVDVSRPAGFHTVVWDLKDDQGLEVPSGVYRAVFTAMDSAGATLYESSEYGFLDGTPVALGKTDADGRVRTEDDRAFPHLIVGETMSMTARGVGCNELGTFSLGGGAHLVLRDSGGMMQTFDVQLNASRNMLELEWCPTCAPGPPTIDIPPRTGLGPTVPGPDPVPEPTFGFEGFCPNPFN